MSTGKYNKRVGKDKLLSDLSRVADELGYPPRTAEYSEHGQFTASSFNHYFDSWGAALDAAGLDPNEKPDERGECGYTDEELLDWIDAWVAEFGVVPTTDDCRVEGPMPSPPTYKNHFGTLAAAIREAGYEPRTRQTEQHDS